MVAGHDAVVRPSLDGFATLDLGPYLPNFRYPSGGTVGAADRPRQDHGGQLLRADPALRVPRLPARGPDPQGPRDADRPGRSTAPSTARSWDCSPRPSCSWSGGGGGQRCGAGVTVRRTAGVLVVVLVAGTLAVRPWDRDDEPVEQVEPGSRWPMRSRTCRCPPRPRPCRSSPGWSPRGTRRLVESAVDSYRRSADFYGTARRRRRRTCPRSCTSPTTGRSSGLLVSDRHDNIGMDPVARAVADQGDATFLLDAGDDTSTGGSWEAFSLESLDDAFDDYDDRVSIAGNHDNGDFVTKQARAARLHHPGRQGRRRAGRDAAARRQRPAQQRPGHLARRAGHLLRGPGAAARRPGLPARRRRRPDQHAAGARREQRPPGPQRGLRRPGAGRAPPRAGRADRHDRERTARSATPTRTGRPAARRTPWPSAASSAATPR